LFTIKTTIALITIFITFSRWKLVNIQGYILKNYVKQLIILKDRVSTWKRLDHLQKFGMPAKKVMNGIKSIMQTVLEKLNKLNLNAFFVEKKLLLKTNQLCTVPLSVGINIEKRQESCDMKATAFFVEKNSQRIRQTILLDPEKHAPDLAQSDGESIKKVYNIQTEHGCYYANNILVKNCDAMTQGLNYLRTASDFNYSYKKIRVGSKIEVY